MAEIGGVSSKISMQRALQMAAVAARIKEESTNSSSFDRVFFVGRERSKMESSWGRGVLKPVIDFQALWTHLQTDLARGQWKKRCSLVSNW